MRRWSRSLADQLYNWSDCIALFCIVNPLFNYLNQFPQLEEAGCVQDWRLLKHSGVRTGWSLIGPLSRKGDDALVFIEEREDFAACGSAHLEDQKSFSKQRMKRVSDGGPPAEPT